MDQRADNQAAGGEGARPTIDRAALAGAMHEIREPLGLLLGAAELLGEEGLDPAARAEMRGMIRRNSEIMSTRIAELFDLVAMESGMFELHPGLHAIDRVVETAAELARHEAGDRPVGVEIGLPEGLEPFVWVDPDRLRQVLYAMLAHGVRTTVRGAVRLEITQRRLGHNRVEMEFSLHAGAGSTPILDGDGSGPGRLGGGFLLTVPARIARLLGGNLVMECAERGVSVMRFTLALPAVEMDTEPELFIDEEGLPTDHEPSLGGVRILVVEDGAANQRLLTQMLRREGAAVHVARDGAVAMGLATNAAGAGRPYRLILMDTGLPGADGLETTRSLRAAGVTCPVVALVGGGGRYTRRACLDAGCADYLTKPLSGAALLGVVRRWTLGGGSAAAA
ncbi:MAG: response regulator [Phycisphaerales bacterium]|nr:response regulator [Phycisphaerales bacterium]